MNHAMLGERDDTPEQDEARLRQAEAALIRINVEKLMLVAANLPKGHGDYRTIQALDESLNVYRRLPTSGQIAQVKALAWQYRRQMPKHLAPKLNPHDPIVREMA